MKKLIKRLYPLVFWLLVWELLSLRVGKSLLLPAPTAVLARVAEMAVSAAFWRITALSILRILAGMLCGVLLGVVFAVLTSFSRVCRGLLSPVLTAVKATPVASFIILALIWMGRDVLPSFIASLMVVPLVWANVSAGIAATDGQLLEMSRVFGFSRLKTALRVYLPSVMPYFLSAFRTALGLSWKAGIAAEVLTLPRGSIGTQLYEAKLYLETTDLFAWTLVIIVCSLVIEKVVMAAVGRFGRRYMAWEAEK